MAADLFLFRIGLMPYVTIGTSQYHYRTGTARPSPNKNVLVLLHGSGGDSSVWDGQLGAAVPLIAPDLPGHGRSDGPPCASLKEYALWLDALFRSLELGTVFLAGHSLGGAVAQEFARLFPLKVAGLILAGTGTHFIVAVEYFKILNDDFAAAVRASCQSAYASGTPEEITLQGCEMLARNGPAVLRGDLHLCRTFNSRPWAAALCVPALVLCGSDDRITPPEASQELARLLPRSQLNIIAGAGHMVMKEAPRAFNEAVKGFIKKLTADS
jgi:pimeloyl-ACP methyl ester carboxylesterase